MTPKEIELIPGHEPNISDQALLAKVNAMDEINYDFKTADSINHPLYREKAQQRVKSLYRLEEHRAGLD